MGAAFAPDWGEGANLSLFSDVSRPPEPGMVLHLPRSLRRPGALSRRPSGTLPAPQPPRPGPPGTAVAGGAFRKLDQVRRKLHARRAAAHDRDRIPVDSTIHLRICARAS